MDYLCGYQPGETRYHLGFHLVEEHNPEIDWQTKRVKMSRCPEKCQTCRAEVRKETQAQRVQTRAAAKRLLECRQGPHPVLVEEVEDEEFSESEVEDESSSDAGDDADPVAPEDEFEEGDRLFYISLPTEAEFIRATQTVSQ